METRHVKKRRLFGSLEEAISSNHRKLIILPPDIHNLTDEEEDCRDEERIMPNDVAGAVEVESESSSGDDDSSEEELRLKRRKKVRPNWLLGDDSF